MNFFTEQFGIYLARWILSAFVMMIPLWIINKYRLTKIFGKYKEYCDLIFVSIIGAFIFYHLDQFIFKQ